MLSKLEIKNWKLKIFAQRAGFTRTSKSWVSGFTLLELIVVIAIATILTTAIVIQQNKWNNRLIVTTQTYELALMIRQAQIYSLGVMEYGAGTGDKFNVGYGVHVSRTTSTSEKVYNFYVDKNNDHLCDSNCQPGSTELLESKNFTRGVKIKKICSVDTTGGSCPPANKQLSVSFFRPDPKAYIRYLDQTSPISPQPGLPAFIKVSNEDETEESIIKIEANGQISIEK